VIVSGNEGYALKCTGCGAVLELTPGDARDAFKHATRKRSMELLHEQCDGYGSQTKARAALKLKRNEMGKPSRRPNDVVAT